MSQMSTKTVEKLQCAENKNVLFFFNLIPQIKTKF